MRRLLTLIVLATLLLSAVNIVLAQNNIPPAVDTVMTDLSQRLGKKIDRDTVNWTFSEELFSDASLGCPQPGQTYKPESIKGYMIDIDVDKVTYDYRYSEKDGSFFLCSPQTPPTPTSPPILIPQSTPTQPPPPTLIPQPTATLTPVPPKVLHVEQPVLAYVAPDGSLQIGQMGGGTAAPVSNYFYGVNALDKLTGDPATVSTYGFLRWAPDGTRLLFSSFPNKTLYVVASGQPPVPLVNDFGLSLDNAVNGAWSADGSQIAYVAQTTGNMSLNIIAASGGAATIVTAIPACSGPAVGVNTSDSAAVAFALDSDRGTISTASALFWLNQDTFLLQNGACQTLMLLSSSGAKWSVSKVTSVAVSPDHSHIVAVKAGDGSSALVSIDITSGMAQPIPGVTQQADQVVWSADGTSIIYSAFTPLGFTTGDPQNALGQQIFGAKWPIQAQANMVSLWRVPAAGGTPTQFFNWQGYRISSIVPAIDNSGVIVSFITSGSTMLKWVAEGRSKDVIAFAAPHPEILSVRFDNPLPKRLAFAGQPAISAGNAFDAFMVPGRDFVTVNSQQCIGAPPSRLVVGQPAHVTPGDPNSMRSSPTGPVVGSIPGGSLLTILAGPACSDKGVAWWQVDFKGIKGWTAEGQGTSYYVEP